jgi:hypothetical protein
MAKTIKRLVKSKKREAVSDVWTVWNDLNRIANDALKGKVSAKNYLRKLWDNESWISIKKKLETEGSIWYDWWMDGVNHHLINLEKRR